MGSRLVSTLSDVADVIDSLHKTPKYADAGYPMVRAVNIEYGPLNLSETRRVTAEVFNDYSKKYFPKRGDIIITRVGANFGETAYVEDTNFCLGQNTAAIIPKEIDPSYLYCILNSVGGRHQMNMLAAGAAQPTLSIKSIKSLQIARLGADHERTVADIVQKLNTKIELNRQTNETLEKMAQALFKSWFVDFDPVIDNALGAGNTIPDALQDRAERRQQQLAKPDHQPLPDDIRQLFPSEFELTEELGWVPMGWTRQQIKDLVEVTDYVANGSFAALKENVRLSDEPEYALYIRTTDFKNGFSTEKAKYVDRPSYDFLKKSYLDGSEILISNVGDVGTVFTAPVWLGKPMTLGSNAIAIRAGKLKHYLFQYFQGDFGQHQLDGITSGSAQQKFNKTGFRSLVTLVPGASILDKFSEVADSLKKQENLAHMNTRNLEVMRDTLLPKLISGELRLPIDALSDAEQQLADATS